MNTKHFYSANDYYKKTFGEKVYRLALDGGFTCPNRDGSKGHGGCTFCSAKGSGDFAGKLNASNIEEALTKAKSLVSKKPAHTYIAYLQAFTSTYAPISYLKELYSLLLSKEDIVALSIATRPDCVDKDIVNLLTELRRAYNKPIYIELGLQTPDDNIANSFNRCYKTECFYDALKLLNAANIDTIVHMILGLPGETPETMVRNVKAIASLNIHGIKLSLLHILSGTAMEVVFRDACAKFFLTDKEKYIETLAKCIEVIPKNVVLYRITGDAPKSLLVAPKFTANKKDVLNSINKYLDENNIRQGSKLEESCNQKP